MTDSCPSYNRNRCAGRLNNRTVRRKNRTGGREDNRDRAVVTAAGPHSHHSRVDPDDRTRRFTSATRFDSTHFQKPGGTGSFDQSAKPIAIVPRIVTSFETAFSTSRFALRYLHPVVSSFSISPPPHSPLKKGGRACLRQRDFTNLFRIGPRASPLGQHAARASAPPLSSVRPSVLSTRWPSCAYRGRPFRR